LKIKAITTIGLLLSSAAALSQTNYDYAALATEKLDRGVVAVRQADGRVFVSWRVLRNDERRQACDIYRNGKRLNKETMDRGGTWLIDDAPPAGQDVVYSVKPLVPLPVPPPGGVTTPPDLPDGQFTLKADAPVGYVSVPLQKPADGVTPDGRTYTYSANDASVADVDGDRQYEIILKWDPSNAHDNAHDGYTGSTIFDCYKISCGKTPGSQLLWRIDLGKNIRSGAHYVPYIVYDLDGDGRAELMVKTADGTRDALGTVVGDSLADWRHRGADADFGRRDEWSRYNRGQRSMTGRILTGPEYISVFDGQTGRVLDTKPYIPERGRLKDWGDEYANRSDRYLAAVGYFGARSGAGSRTIMPSAVFCRGYYTRSVLAAWDWDGKELKQRWVFDTNLPEWGSYAGQGNHNLRVADVDGDGLDEIIYGAMTVDHDGRGLYNTGMGHGDAMHLVADPQTNKLYVWDCHENRRDGSELHDAATGEVVFQVKSQSDVGRCMAADIDPTNPGVEMWSSDSHGIRTMKGEILSQVKDADNPQHDNSLQMGLRRLSINFGIWWDGDLLRELLDRATVSKYDWEQGTIVDVQRFEGAVFNNGTKSNPCLQADVLGDWREEVIVRNAESTELRIYTSTIPTDHRINCLMQDIPYRLSVAYQNVGYNQPPEPGFYLGPDRTDYLK
jgi:rhamnogalacturonan endolyase